jgi:hypothetical protein
MKVKRSVFLTQLLTDIEKTFIFLLVPFSISQVSHARKLVLLRINITEIFNQMTPNKTKPDIKSQPISTANSNAKLRKL